MQFTAKQFDGNNFTNWTMHMRIGFADGSCVKAEEGPVDYF